MRLFVALELNSEVVVALTELIRRLQPHAQLRWVHPENMHVTLKYIGEWSPKRLDEVVSQLSEVRLPATEPVLNVPVAGLGFFPNAHRPRVFWAGAENTPRYGNWRAALTPRCSRSALLLKFAPTIPI